MSDTRTIRSLAQDRPDSSLGNVEWESKALRRRLEDLTRLVSDWVWETDDELRLTYVSARVFEILHFHPYELMGKQLSDIGSFKTSEGQPSEVDLHSPFRDQPFNIMDRLGETRDFLLSGLPVYDDESGALIGVRGTARDITEHKRAQEALRLSEQRLRAFLDNAPAMVSLRDLEGRYLLINKEFDRHFSIDLKNDEDSAAENLFPQEVAESFEFQEKKVVESKGPITQEHIIPHLDGNFVHLCTKFPIFDVSGDVLAVGSISTDITDRKNAEKDRDDALIEAKEASKAKTDFLATMSHELRTPLNAILGFSNILSQQYLGPIGEKKYLEYAAHIEDSGRYLLDLINDVLDISKIEAGEYLLYQTAINLNAVVDDCINLVSQRAAVHGINLVKDLPKNLPSLYADERAVKQILLNLLANALNFTPEGGTVGVTASNAGEFHIVTVNDTGPGIPAREIPFLLEPFKMNRANPHVSREGSGLGLAITQSLVSLHGGTLTIGRNADNGAAVKISLPSK